MISAVALLLFLGLIVFGPKKTIEIAQEIGRVLAQVKRAAGEFQESATDSMATQNRAHPHARPDVKTLAVNERDTAGRA